MEVKNTAKSTSSKLFKWVMITVIAAATLITIYLTVKLIVTGASFR